MLSFTVRSQQREELVDITTEVARGVAAAGLQEGVCWLFVPHTTAALTVNENADPGVLADILARLQALVPRDGRYRHIEENADAHIKASLVGAFQAVPVSGGRLQLGRWQAVFLCEFDGPRERAVYLQALPAA